VRDPNMTLVSVSNATLACRLDQNIFVVPQFIGKFSVGPYEGYNHNKSSRRSYEDQRGFFDISPVDGAVLQAAVRPHVVLPCGSLVLELTDSALSSTNFSIALVDSQADDGTTQRSQAQHFVVEVLPAIVLPSFELRLHELKMFEGAGDFFNESVAYDIQSGSGMWGNTSFKIAVQYPSLFAVQPVMSLDGALNFSLSPYQHGTTKLTITLESVFHDLRTSLIVSAERVIVLTVLPVNQKPTFIVRDVFIVKNCPVLADEICQNRFHIVENFVSQLVVDMPNQVCNDKGIFCDHQNVTFVVDDVTNPSLFNIQPAIHANGSLTFSVNPDLTGESTVMLHARDDGPINSDVRFAGDNTSTRHSFKVLIDTVDYPPAFALQRNVSCGNLNATRNETCTCPSLQNSTLSYQVCSAPMNILRNDSVTVEILQGAGVLLIDNFASYVSSAEGYFAKHTSIFEFPKPTAGVVTSAVNFSVQRSDPVAAIRGLGKYYTDFVVSPDKKHIYAVQRETNSLSIAQIQNQNISQTVFLDRRSDGEDRVRFRGFTQYANNDTDFISYSLTELCHLSTLSIGHSAYIMNSAGCQYIPETQSPPSECAVDKLTVPCDVNCCNELLLQTVGYWVFESASLYGSQLVQKSLESFGNLTCNESMCTYSRNRLQSNCDERYDTIYGPATFRDSSGVLGAALVLGAGMECKANAFADWDRTPQATMSPLNFIANDGAKEAVQLNLLNPRLVVSGNTVALANVLQKQLAVSLWLTIEKDTVESGLLSAGYFSSCVKGWTISYARSPTSTSFHFNFSATTSLQRKIINTYRRTPTVELGRWTHLAVSYNGTGVDFYVNGVLVQSKIACPTDCGSLKYTSDTAQCQFDNPFLLGDLGITSDQQQHTGMLRSVRMFKRALVAGEVDFLFKQENFTSVPLDNYWVHGSGRIVNHTMLGVISPSGDFSTVNEVTSIMLHGRFSKGYGYRCEFVSALQTGVSAISFPFCDDPTFCNFLICKDIVWPWGMTATTMRLIRRNVTRGSETLLWQRVCYDESCGYILPDQRNVSAWWMIGTENGTAKLDTGCTGLLTTFRFLLRSEIDRLDVLSKNVQRLKSLSPLTVTQDFRFDNYTYNITNISGVVDIKANVTSRNYTLHVGLWNRTVCPASVLTVINTTDPILPYFHHFCNFSNITCKNGICTFFNNLTVLGVASITPLNFAGQTYLMVANYWDGASTSVLSPLLQMHINNVSGELELSHVQSVLTSGARRWSYVHVNSNWDNAQTLLILTSFIEYSKGYRLNSSRSAPIEGSDPITFRAAFSASSCTFEIMNVSYIAFASFSSNQDSSVFALGVPKNSSYSYFDDLLVPHDPEYNDKKSSARKVLSLATTNAFDVVHVQVENRNFLMFASFMLNGNSQIFELKGSKMISSASLLQALNVPYATSLRPFTYSTSYILVGSASRLTEMYRWNGTQFTGALTANTPAAQSSGGQQIAFANVSSLVLVEWSSSDQSDVCNSKLPVLLVGIRSFDPTVSASVKLLRAWRECVAEMRRPVAVDVLPSGKFVYVASAESRSISVFWRDPVQGHLIYSESASFTSQYSSVMQGIASNAVTKDQVLGKYQFGFPLRSIQSIQVGPDSLHLYVTSFIDHSVSVFDIDQSTGGLTLLQTLTEGESQAGIVTKGIQGAAGLHVADRVYVTGWLDNAVSVFSKSTSGEMSFCDATYNGEVNFLSFNLSSQNTLIPINALTRSQSFLEGNFYPRRIGSFQNSWALSARATRHFQIDQVDYLALASSDGETGVGAVTIYQWRSLDNKFVLFQTIAGNAAANSITYFNISDRAGHLLHYLAVSNSMTSSCDPASNGVNVYSWNQGLQLFELFQAIQNTDSARNSLTGAVHVEFFTLSADVHYLAVAYYDDCYKNTSIESVIYRWNPYGWMRQTSGAAMTWSPGFEPFQRVPTSAAVRMEFHDRFLVISNFYDGESCSFDNIHVYVYNKDLYNDLLRSPSGAFEIRQKIAGHGTTGTKMFDLQGVGLLMAVANRQSDLYRTDDMSVYDVASLIYIWNDTCVNEWNQNLAPGCFVQYQTLQFKSSMANITIPDSLYTQVTSSSSSVLDQFRGNMSARYCMGDVCTTSDDGTTTVINSLRGATRMHFFQDGGDLFLAVAQSACNFSTSRAVCVGEAGAGAAVPQSRSSVFQWEKSSKRFVEMLAINSENAKYPHHHQYAMRIDVGQALNIEDFIIDNQHFLVFSSHTHGAIIFLWQFEHVNGMSGPVSVTAADTNVMSTIFVLSELEHSLVTFDIASVFDGLGRRQSLCDSVGFKFRGAKVEQLLTKGGQAVDPRKQSALGLNGGKKLLSSCLASNSSRNMFWLFQTADVQFNQKCKVTVFAGPRRDEDMCSGAGTAISINGEAVPCQGVTFVVTQLSADPPQFFVPNLTLHVNGTLALLAPSISGAASYRVELVDDALATSYEGRRLGDDRSAPRFFNLVAIPTTAVPTFVAFDVFCNQGTGLQSLVFASDISFGAAGSFLSDMYWEFTWSKATFFLTQPQLTLGLVEGFPMGILSFTPTAGGFGTSVFTVRLINKYSLALKRGSFASVRKNFTLTVRPVNQPPSFTPRASIINVTAGNGTYLEKGFVTQLTAGNAAEDKTQLVSFSIAGIHSGNQFLTQDMLFSNFLLNSTLITFTVLPNRTGNFNLTLMVQDSGGTADGGINYSLINVQLVVLPSDKLPKFSPRTLKVPEAKIFLPQVFPNFLVREISDLAIKSRNFSFWTQSSNQNLFVQGPNISYPDGTLSFVLNPFHNGVANLTIWLFDASQRLNISTNKNFFSAQIIVIPVNDPPSFNVTSEYQCVENSGPQVVRNFIFDALPGPPDERWQSIFYNIHIENLSPNLFSSSPYIDSSGTLYFTSAQDAHGSATLVISAFDDGGSDFGGLATNSSVALVAVVRVLPLPRLLGITPAVLPSSTSMQVTVLGLYFGSSYSRGFTASQYFNAQVFFGDAPCANVSILSDSKIVCEAPSVQGAQQLSLRVDERGLLRDVSLPKDVFFNSFYVGGLGLGATGNGFMGYGYSRLTSGRVSFHPDDMLVDGTILAIYTEAHVTVFGGSFRTVNSVIVNHVFMWNGATIKPFGFGVDGEVKALAKYGKSLLMGGSFTKGFSLRGAATQSGGLIMWDGGRWRLVNGILQGEVRAIVTNESRIFVGGQFNQFCSRPFNGIAMFDGQEWLSLGDGVAGGSVQDLAVYGNLLVVAGSFTSANGLPIAKLALWTGTSWQGLGRVEGDVFAVVTWGGSLFAGGAMQAIDGVSVKGFARLSLLQDYSQYANPWVPVGEGINGYVTSMATADECVYAVGDIDRVFSIPGAGAAASNGFRVCRASGWTEYEAMVEDENKTSSILYVIAPAGRSVESPPILPLLLNSTNTTWSNSTNQTQG